MPLISNIPAVQQVAALMRAHGVIRCVLCPGSRNSPLLKTLAAIDGMECRSITDERSAGFIGLGWAAQSQQVVAIVVTSGSATLNLHPAVAEAHYRQIPLLIITADRPQAWINQQDGQTLPQGNIFGSLVKSKVTLPEGNSPQDHWHRNRLINEAILSVWHHGKGPAQINIPIPDQLFGIEDCELPTERRIQRLELAQMSGLEEKKLLTQVESQPRRLILIGQQTSPPAITAKLRDKGFVILAEHLANCGSIPHIITQPELCLKKHPQPEQLSPDILISMGGEIVSKDIKEWLRKHPPREHWHISENGEVIDCFGCLSQIIEGESQDVWELLEAFLEDIEHESISHQYLQAWEKIAHTSQFRPPTQRPYGSARLVEELIASLPLPCTMHLANSSTVRYAMRTPIPASVQLECNRGVNGIEGSLSAAIGYAMAEVEKANILIIGDLSFFYDMNALAHARQSPNLRILLLNNGGGGIFRHIPGMKSDPESHLEAQGLDFVIAPHQNRAKGWAESLGLRYMAVEQLSDYPEALAQLCASKISGTLIVEAFVP